MSDLPAVAPTIPRARPWSAWLARLLIVLPFGLYLWLVYRYGVNVPVNGEWPLVPFVAKVMRGEAWQGDLFTQFNENRFAVLRLLLVWLAPLTGWNTLLMMYLCVGMAALALWGLWHIYRRAVGPRLWEFVPVAWLWVNFSQYENMLFGAQLTFWNAIAAGIWAVHFMTQPGWWAFGIACMLALLSTFSATSGLALWPAGFGVLLLTHAPRRKWLLWLLLGAGVITFYFNGFNFGLVQAGESQHSPLGQLLRVPPVVLIVMANTIGSALPDGRVSMALAVGMAMGAMIALLLWLQWRKRAWFPRHEWPAWGLLLFGSAVALLIAVGRGRFGLWAGLLSRYVTLGMPSLVAIYILLLSRLSRSPQWIDLAAWSRSALPSRWRSLRIPQRTSTQIPSRIPTRLLIGGIALFLFLSALGADWQGFARAVTWSRRLGYTTKFILQTTADPMPLLQRAAPPLAVVAPYMAQNIPLARELGINVFADPVAWWLLLLPDDRQLTSPLLATPTLTQHVTCPVATLYDVALEFAHQGQPAMIYVQLFGEAQTAPLAAGMLDLAKLEGEGGWGLLRLAQPLHECQGQALRVEITAARAVAGISARAAAVHYPAYYPGTLIVGAQTLPGRSLGLELNVHHFPIRDGLVHFTPVE